MKSKQKRIGDGAERRESRRFTLRLPLRYRAEGQSGTGEVLNISSRGVLFTIGDNQVPAGQVELFISWPVLLDEAVALNLVAVGPVVRSETGTVAVKINRYEFRTTKAPAAKRNPAFADPGVHVTPARAASALSFA